mmetsp:Transcript_6955/g.10137  ORF Transcript_6955/g.10137 Transcript_6955/m.10137 type:complete len:623 (+) Transcript_6955:119-1987(+)
MSSEAVGVGMVQYGGEPPGQNRMKQIPVYQIDFTAIASGKHVAATKRRVRWRFGFANMEAIQAGESGTACRGEEHDVTLVWSITSGKRLILADGHEVHYSMVRGQTFEFSWTMKGNHVLKVIAHAAPPAQRIPGFRQYDFFIDGKSFFSMPKVYRLGMAPNPSNGATNSVHRTNDPMPAAHRSPTYSNYSLTEGSHNGNATPISALETPHNAEEERAYLEEAIKNSLRDSNSSKAAPAPSVEDLLMIDFGADPIPISSNTSQPSYGSEQVAAEDQAAVVPLNPFAFDGGYYQGQSSASLQAPAGYYPEQTEASFSTPTAAFAQQPFAFDSGYNQGQSNASLQAPTAASPFGSDAGYYQTYTNASVPTPSAASATPFDSGYYQGQSNAPLGVPNQSIAAASDNPFSFDSGIQAPTSVPEQHSTTVQPSVPVSVSDVVPVQQNSAHQVGGIKKNITGRSAEEAYKNLLQGDFSITGKSQAKNPFDFTEDSKIDASGWGGTQTTLSQMQAVKKNETKKEIMKSNGGMMVVSSNQQGNWSGYGNGVQTYGGYAGAAPVLGGQQYPTPQQMQHQPQQMQYQQPAPQQMPYPQQQMQYPQQSQQYGTQMQYPQHSGQQAQYNQFQQGY